MGTPMYVYAGLPWRPIITYATSTLIDLSLPQKLWSYDWKLIGGSRKGSAGNVETFVIREENIANLSLRVHDCELLQVRAWILNAMRGNTFQLQFDRDDAFSVFTCYLDSPSFDEGFKPRREPGWPNTWNVDISIRAVENIPIYVSTGDCGSTSVLPLSWVLTNLPNGDGRYVLALNPPYGGGASLEDPTTTFDGAAPLRGTVPAVEWISRPLTAGLFVPSSAILGGTDPDSPAERWLRLGAYLEFYQWRGGEIIAAFNSGDRGFGWLGGGTYESFDLSSVDVLTIQSGDRIGIAAFTYQQPRIDTGVPYSGDELIVYSWGSVPGPSTTTRLYGSGNVEEL